jgi:hypothetical protein
VAGGLLGGAGAYGLAKGYNLARRSDNRVRWSLEHFAGQTEALLVSYLAVAHFGRGRGAWEEGEPPAAWFAAVRSATAAARPALERCWNKHQGKKGAPPGAAASTTRAALPPLVRSALRQVLTELYPDADPGWDRRRVQAMP